MGKAALNKNQNLFTRKFELNLRHKLLKCYIGSTAPCGAENWILRKLERHSYKVFKCDFGEGR
jgi:hypothetical protein